jgi:hypothetical protein
MGVEVVWPGKAVQGPLTAGGAASGYGDSGLGFEGPLGASGTDYGAIWERAGVPPWEATRAEAVSRGGERRPRKGELGPEKASGYGDSGLGFEGPLGASGTDYGAIWERAGVPGENGRDRGKRREPAEGARAEAVSRGGESRGGRKARGKKSLDNDPRFLLDFAVTAIPIILAIKFLARKPWRTYGVR